MGSHIYFQRRSTERGDGSELIISNATSPVRGMDANYYLFPVPNLEDEGRVRGVLFVFVHDSVGFCLTSLLHSSVGVR